MARRRPVRVVHTRVVYFGTGRPRPRRWPWPYIGAGVLAVAILPREPMLAALILAITLYLWRSQYGRRR
jgi:hypothetical protein